MERHFDSALRELKEQLVTMAVTSSARSRTRHWAFKQDMNVLSRIMETEHKINASHMAIDESCVKLLALHQPLARDLRLIIAILKINTDLERMGDQSVNIADNSAAILRERPSRSSSICPRWPGSPPDGQGAIDAFVKGDVTQAREVLNRDDSVDAFKSKIFKDVLE